jgi:hypothetical protein
MIMRGFPYRFTANLKRDRNTLTHFVIFAEAGMTVSLFKHFNSMLVLKRPTFVPNRFNTQPLNHQNNAAQTGWYFW